MERGEKKKLVSKAKKPTALDAPPPQKSLKSIRKGITDKRILTALKRERHAELQTERDRKLINTVAPTDSGYIKADPTERTYKFRQSELREHVGIASARKQIDLNLPSYGLCSVAFSRNGRYMLIGGTKGHLFLCDRLDNKPLFEINLDQTVKAVSFLQNEKMVAVAQRKYVYLYDKQGIEVQCLKDHIDVNCLDFLPYHLLLTSIGNAGYLRYQDVSTGDMVSEHRTGMGPVDVMTHNPWNSVTLCGHANGVVSFWSPTCGQKALMTMLTENGPVRGVSVSRSGREMATIGLEGTVKVWDIRQTLRPIVKWWLPSRKAATCIAISERGMVAVGQNDTTLVYKDCLANRPSRAYLQHTLSAIQSRNSTAALLSSFSSSAMTKGTFSVESMGVGKGSRASLASTEGSRTTKGGVRALAFCPYDDVLAVGYGAGVTTLLVPGSGEPNYDSFEADPYETKKRQQEGEIKQLIDKLQPETISLNPNAIGTLMPRHNEEKETIRQLNKEFKKKVGPAFDPSKADKPKKHISPSLKKLKKQKKNVITERKIDLLHQVRLERQQKLNELRSKAKGIRKKKEEDDPLQRFVVKME
ncbi:putative U3 snoRNP-associated protein Utp7 [Monocercomonoides exilis]|uniref:putative U3 snoRNP-associated protein Utp7 n=1 Tax=Monocercomonoides exilis TaxID=2049356 RepID=UPI003559F622|nr:putative U3 snoRNP-associated protein Utp7 [Monocercomonoides exilis]|eukprot:MONOS_9261.1-p1 / transcript=MONOS_9261.1 / gene=MONOS_9261 / organism=Monocercomonoides_exilis_PA203 / gene_product=U3 snoRNP-associated protein Utp7 / transcript_product=U3 snoRNP-associated protein Utp7 / location=Mono_scaffold00375:48921-51390(-) / protein_length=586 / sequence_SO=supercontig / SO=protein_coding / is_pseudo=false